MLRTLFVPSACGDLRLEAAGSKSRLTVVNPTVTEIPILRRYVALAREKGWTTMTDALLENALTLKDFSFVLPLEVDVDTAGGLLLGSQRPSKGILVGVVYADGRVSATLDGPLAVDDLFEGFPIKTLPGVVPTDTEAPAQITAGDATKAAAGDAAKAATPSGEGDTIQPVSAIIGDTDANLQAKAAQDKAAQDKAAQDKAPVKVVVTERPTLCCPIPTPGPMDRASEVLRTFLTADQWDEWCQDGMIHVRGNLTGDTYRVVHRKHPLAAKQGKAAWNVTEDHVVHCHLTHLPPPEETLSIVLTLQFGEDWIRNPSGWFGGGRRFQHPLGLGSSDGTQSSALLYTVSELLGGGPPASGNVGMALSNPYPSAG